MDDEGVQARYASRVRSYRPGDSCTISKTRRAGALGACDGRMWKTVEDKNRSALEHWTSCVCLLIYYQRLGFDEKNDMYLTSLRETHANRHREPPPPSAQK